VSPQHGTALAAVSHAHPAVGLVQLEVPVCVVSTFTTRSTLDRHWTSVPAVQVFESIIILSL
jgi:hypothetical protein